MKKESNYILKESEHSSNLQNPNFVYLLPSEREDAMFGKGRFKLRFQEIIGTMVDGNFCSAICKFVSYRFKNKMEVKNAPQTEEDFKQVERLLPIVTPTFPKAKNKITYTWIGHSTAVISFGQDATFIIDPVFSERASPYSFAGPKRYRKPACEIEQLPQIDAVLVSHDHYDHLDQNALDRLQKHSKPIFVAGLDSSDVFPKHSNLIQVDWMKPKQIKINGANFKITFVPVCHWSRRGLTDLCKRLWGGFIVQGPNNRKMFYSGDTGYCGVFKQIGDQYGPFDLCILPIGAYEPRQLLAAQHVNPQEAVILHQELKSKKSVGVHWGTFPLGFEHFGIAKEDLQIAKQKHNLSKDEFVTVVHGGNFSIDY